MAKGIKALGLGRTNIDYGKLPNVKITNLILTASGEKLILTIKASKGLFESFTGVAVNVYINTNNHFRFDFGAAKNAFFREGIWVFETHISKTQGPIRMKETFTLNVQANATLNGQLLDTKNQDFTITADSIKGKLFLSIGGNKEEEEKETANNTNVVTYHIYWNSETEGKIEKQGDENTATQATYIYIDKNNKEHLVCTPKWHKETKKSNGLTIGSFRKEKEIKIEYYNETGVDARESRTYSNEDVITKGNFRVKYRIYKAIKNTKINLVEFPIIDYQNNGIIIKFLFYKTMRRYINPDLLSGFIGALAECNYLDVFSSGSCFNDGTCYPSVSHVNGESIDFLYFDTHDKPQKFINALYKFHFGLFLIGTNMKYTHGTPDKHHDDHLHIGKFNHSIIKK